MGRTSKQVDRHKMIGFLIDVEFVWGFQSKIVGYSKTSPSFTYPPPTTILGAIAEHIAKENVLGEGKAREVIPMLSKKLLAIGLRPVNCLSIKFSDLNRLIAIRITTGIHYPTTKDLSGSYDAPATGKTILTSLNGEPPKLTLYLVFEDSSVGRIGDKEIIIDKYAMWNIHRLGSKESIVSVIDVKEFEPQKLTGELTTTYSFPLIDGVTLIKDVIQKWSQELLINPFNLQLYDPVTQYLLGQKTVRFYVPILESPNCQPTYKLKVAGNTCGYKYDEEVLVGICAVA
ncbi:MAG: type I-A CRISPR-associated protein Cas5a [Candidatus Nitrosocaldus sp.]